MTVTRSPSVDGYVENDRSFQHAIELLERGGDRGFMRFVDLLDTYKIVDTSSNTLLHWAAAYGSCQLVEHLLSLGIPVDARNAAQATPLLCAAASCANPGAMITTLALRGADLRVVNEIGDGVLSLLSARHMPDVAAVCDALQKSIGPHAEYYAVTAVPPPAMPGNAAAKVMRHLGTSRLLPPSSPGSPGAPGVSASPIGSARRPMSVSFQRSNAGRPPSGQSSGRLRSSEYPPALSSARRHWSGDDISSSSLNSVTGGLVLENGKHGYCCDAAWWLADSERALLFAHETQQRERIDIDYYEAHLDLLYRFFGIEAEQDDVVDNIVAVLGEKFTANSQRMLLVRWWVEDVATPTAMAAGDSDDAVAPADEEPSELKKVFIEDWVPLDEIATSQKVRDYVARFDRTYSTTFSATSDRFAGFQGNDDLTDGDACVLDESEREELERELGLIPSRRLSSGMSTPSRTSVILSQDISSVPGVQSPLRALFTNSAGSGHAKGASFGEFRPQMSAGERAARLCQSEKSVDDMVPGESSPPTDKMQNAEGGAPEAVVSSVMSTAPGQPPLLHSTDFPHTDAVTALAAFDEDASSPNGSGESNVVRDTGTDASQHSFRSGATLPPHPGDSTAASVVSTISEAAASPKGLTASDARDPASTSLAPPTPPSRSLLPPPTPPVVTRRSPPVRCTVPVQDPRPPCDTKPNSDPVQYCLTDSQKNAYDQFLFASAMRYLRK